MKKINNSDINIKNIDKIVELYGWVSKKRDLGGLIFIDLRDRSGIIQLVVHPDNKNYEVASNLKNESVIKVTGRVCKRENANKNIKTGEIEVIVDTLVLINSANLLPFEITDNTSALEDTRLKYRYLDLRRDTLKNNIITRAKIMKSARSFLDDNNFIEKVKVNFMRCLNLPKYLNNF